MSAETFYQTSKGSTMKIAFDRAVKFALHEFGHRGYTGTISEG